MNKTARALLVGLREAGLVVAYKHTKDGGYRLTVARASTKERVLGAMGPDLAVRLRLAATNAGCPVESCAPHEGDVAFQSVAAGDSSTSWKRNCR